MKILSMSGLIPEHICDTVRFTQYTGDRNISHYCGYASDFISQVIQDDTIDGAVFPKSCDSTRILLSYLSDTEKFIHQINVPQIGLVGSIQYFASEICRYKENVEKYFGIRIDDIGERIELINKRNQELKAIYDSLDSILYSDYIRTIHHLLTLPLHEQKIPKIEENASDNKRVYLIGSFIYNIEIIRTIESVGLKIVGDDLPESGRLVSGKRISPGKDYYESIARNILEQHRSPSQNGFRTILENDIREIENKDISGVIFICQQYCEPYEYYYSLIKKELDQKGIQVLKLSLSGVDDLRRSTIALEAFADTL